jgi:ElaB/YqjD/DUF883 family membrane-anchored ribosome-binding protein
MPLGLDSSRKDTDVFSNEALIRILTEADRIVEDAETLLEKAAATGKDDLVEAARKNLRLVIENRDRLNRVFSLKLATAESKA